MLKLIFAAMIIANSIALALLLVYKYRPSAFNFLKNAGQRLKKKKVEELIEVIQAPKYTSLFSTVKKMLSEHYPEQEILKSMQEMGLSGETAGKVLLLSKTSALDACRQEAQSTTVRNVEAQLEAIHQKLSSSRQYSDVAEKLGDIGEGKIVKKALDEKQLSLGEMAEIVAELFSKDYSELRILAMFSELGIGEATARAVISSAKKTRQEAVQRTRAEQPPAPEEQPPAPEEQLLMPKEQGSSNGKNGKSILDAVDWMLSHNYPDSQIVDSLIDLGVGEVSAKKLVLLAKSKALELFKKEFEKITVENIKPALDGIEKKLESAALQREKEKIEKLKKLGEFSTKKDEDISLKMQGVGGESAAKAVEGKKVAEVVEGGAAPASPMGQTQKIEKKLDSMEQTLKKELKALGSMASSRDQRFVDAVGSLGTEISRIRKDIEKYKRKMKKSEGFSSKLSKVQDMHERLLKMKEESALDKKSIGSMLGEIKLGDSKEKKDLKYKGS